jgi:putative FmdB family regulatory protein
VPIYEYRCGTCGHRFDHMAKWSDPPPSCPSLTDGGTCGHDTQKQITGGGTFRLKGGGWAADGYATPAPTKGDD